MKRLFGKKTEQAPKPTLGDASGRLDAREGVIDEKIKKLDDKLLGLRDQIKRTRGPQQERAKKQALEILKQKRMYEGQQSQVYNQRFAIEQMEFTSQQMEDTKLMVAVQKDATKSMRKMMKNFSVAEVENMQEDLVDLYEEQQEIQEIMGRNYTLEDVDVDEDALGDELDALAFDMEKEKDATYLDEALATPATRLPELPAGNTETEEISNPASLEAQLGL